MSKSLLSRKLPLSPSMFHCRFRLISVTAQKIVAEIANNTFQQCKGMQGLVVIENLKNQKVLTTHCHTIKSGSFADIYIANNILRSYTKCRDLNLAYKMFDEMSHKDTVSWNTMIAGFVSCGRLVTTLEFLNSMRRYGFDVDGYTFGSILKGSAYASRLDLGQQVHSMVIKIGYEDDVYAGSALLDMYAKCDRVEDAYLVFQGIPEPNHVSWNAMIAGFAQVGDLETAFWLFSCMEFEGVNIDDGTFAPLLTLLDDPESHKLTMQLHGKVIKQGLEFNTIVCNAKINSYAECGSIEDARRIFEGSVGIRDLVTWNSMIAAYLGQGQEQHAFEIFINMQALGIEADIYTYTSIISACSEKAHRNGISLHGLVVKRGVEHLASVSNALITMYLKSNDKSMEDAIKIFESLESKDRVSWNSILTGFSQNGLSENAVKCFGHMRSSLVEIDQYAFSSVLKSCSDLATLQLGQQVHVLAIKSGFESNEFVASSLIFMYSKCGIIQDAQKSFGEASKYSSISWNSIIFGYAQHGLGDMALDLFHQMKEKKVKLDNITFVAVLTACSHIGLVEEGCNFLCSMESDYGVPPRLEHYACAVDLLGRAGYLDRAKALIESMPFEPDAMVWKTFLGACRACGNIQLATQVASYLLELDPEEHCTYVLLSNMYSHLKRWDEKACLTRLMRERGVRKVPGWSWIEIKHQVHAFNAEDRSHPHCEQIYMRLGQLMDEIKWLDSAASLDVLFCDSYCMS